MVVLDIIGLMQLLEPLNFEICQVCQKSFKSLTNRHLRKHNTNLYEYGQKYGPTQNYSKTLIISHPNLVTEWHPTRNGKKSLEDYTYGSQTRVWWLCERGHEWENYIAERSRGRGCLYCANKAVCDDNCLATTHPKIAAEWHLTKNGKKSPKDYTYGSAVKVWWLCGRGHEWETSINKRTQSCNCPYCINRAVNNYNCLATTHPRIAAEWHLTKNGKKSPGDYTYGSTIKVWWLCEKGHEWKTSIHTRTKGRNCPYCANQAVNNYNCLATTHPRIAAEWHLTKNGKKSPRDYTYGSAIKVWWLCEKGHEWKTSIRIRAQGYGCLYCANKATCDDNCLATTHPKIAAEWHPTKNGKKSPKDYTYGNQTRVWWLCEKGHEWYTSVHIRAQGYGCLYCANKATCDDNCLATTHPKIAAEWHPTKNKKSPRDYTYGSNVKVWWLCGRGHEWHTFIKNRTRGVGCPLCNLVCASKIQIQIAFELNNFIITSYHNVRIETAKGKESVDYYFPDLNLVAEFDGSYWHQYRLESDIKKTSRLFKENTVIRLRCAPLEKITDYDVIIPKNKNNDAKYCAIKLLKQIEKLYGFEFPQLDAYINTSGLLSEKEANAYIKAHLK